MNVELTKEEERLLDKMRSSDIFPASDKDAPLDIEALKADYPANAFDANGRFVLPKDRN